MVLQYSTNGTECYEESPSICFLIIPIIDEKNIVDVMEVAEGKVSKVWGKPVFEIREDNIIRQSSKFVKIAILNERDRSDSKALIFSENTVLCLLNENKKTLKMF